MNLLLQRLGCDNILESPQQEDPCLQCGGNGQSCSMVKNTFSLADLPNGTEHILIFYPRISGIILHLFSTSGYNQMFIIPAGATTISIRETVSTRNYLGECVHVY